MLQMDPHHCQLELRRILDESLECADRLEELLHDERDALEAPDAESLLAIATSKELCVRCMESLESERRSLCAAAGYGAGEAGMKDLLEWCDHGSVVTPLWHRLLKTARQCEALNRTNGAVGHLRYEHLTAAIAVLGGGSEDTALYGSKGRQTAPTGRRALASI